MKSSRDLILVPAIITLGVTLLRLLGELLGWSKALFNSEAGGQAAVVGIVWLIPVFGVYFAWKLVRSGRPSVGAGKGIAFPLIAIVIVLVLAGIAGGATNPPVIALVIIALIILGLLYLLKARWHVILTLFGGLILASLYLAYAGAGLTSTAGVLVLGLICLASMLVTREGWTELFSVLWAYGLAARIPVVVIMFLAIFGNWGTHYDAPPPGFPETGWFLKWVLIGVVPQLTVWMATTVNLGALFGGIALLFVSSGRAQEPESEDK
jgi:hypothetical protein